MNEKPTSWTLYPSNHEAWEAMLSDCAHATTTIDLEQFIFVKDEFGQRLIDICIERAKVGVKVRFLWDAAGSFTFWGSSIAEDLRNKGIELVFWKTLIPSYFKVPSIRSWFLRNHRRALIIDNKIGYTGSICVQDAMKNWRDTNVRLDGVVVAKMQYEFDHMWVKSRGDKQILPVFQSQPDPEFAYITNSPSPRKRHLYRTILTAIRTAEKYIYITTPYFVPTHRMLRAIKLAAQRGVDVRILLPEKSDHYPALDLGARSYFQILLESGVHIFLYEGNIVHSKTIVIDDTWASVGSMNFDSVSLLYNYEANIVTSNTRFAEELSSHFATDIGSATEVSLAEWKNRFFIEKIPEILIKVVRRFL
jgi:cardiolipin synthase A/B